ncbi:MAG: GH39 family glycosyl hydrolase [Myxococcaceae bacterium]
MNWLNREAGPRGASAAPDFSATPSKGYRMLTIARARPEPMALALLAVLGVCSAHAAAPTVGINSHVPTPAESALIAQAGVSAVRMDFNWMQFQPARGTYSFAYLDQSVNAARANGLLIFPSVGYTPRWAGPLASCDDAAADYQQHCLNKAPVDVADWTDAVTTVVNRYKGKVLCWGIWNEPNLKGFFDGSQDDFVNKIFLPAAAAIRAADPTAKICGPELSGLGKGSAWNGKNGTCLFGNCIRNGWEIDLAEMLDRVGPQIDIITHHVYAGDSTVAMLLDGETTAGVLVHDSVRNVINTHGGAGKEFWLTEAGFSHKPVGDYTEAEVATKIVDLFSRQEQVCAGTYAGSTVDPWNVWTRTFYFHFQSDPFGDYGIVTPTSAPRQAYTALKNWATPRTTTACGAAPQPPDAGTPDAGKPDAGKPDAGMPDAGSDAGAFDAGSGEGPADSGQAEADGGAVASDGGGSPGDGGPGDLDAQVYGCGATRSGSSSFPLWFALAWLATVGLAARAGRRHARK